MKTLNLNNAQTRLSFLGGIAILATLAITASSASAQYYYKGDAYGAKVQINASVINTVGVGVGATIVDNPDLPIHGSNSALTNQLLNANVSADLVSPVASFAVLTANTINTSTIGPATSATSFSQIEGLSLFPNFGVNLGLLGNLNLISLVRADVIRSTTTANEFGNSGHTEIANLRFGLNSLGNFDITSAVSTTYYLNILGQASVTASANVLIPDIARLDINKQTVFNDVPLPGNVGKTRTTDAISVTVLEHARLANASVTIASSTAGFAVPESGSMTYALSAGLLLAGPAMIRLRRRLKK